jgi:hypothetical protein
MDVKTEPEVPAAHREISLFRGGPFYHAQRKTRLIHPDRWNLGRRLTFVISVGWVPLFILTALFNRGGLLSLLLEYRIHSRMLIAVPVLLVGQLLMESRFQMIVVHISQSNLLAAPELKRMDEVIDTLIRLRDSALPELLILLFLVVHTTTSYKGLVDPTPWVGYRVGGEIHMTPAAWYAVLVSATIFQFFLGLNLWKWLLWTFFAFKLSRMNLKLVATHPDGHGGLGFLGLTPAAFAPIIFAAATVIGSTWRYDILHRGVELMSFKLPAIAFLVIVALVALGPLAFFVPKLITLRRNGILEYGILGQLHSTDFHQKWIIHRAGHEDEFLTAPESSALADFGSSYEKLKELKPFPADNGVFIALALSAVIPLLPVILAVIPLAVVLKSLLEALR